MVQSPAGSPTSHGCFPLFETSVITQEGAGPRASGVPGGLHSSHATSWRAFYRGSSTIRPSLMLMLPLSTTLSSYLSQKHST